MVINNLLQVKIGTTIRIQSFEGGKALASKLRQYGLFIGDQARVLRMGTFAGPILLEVNGREIALGRGIAAKIIVETI
jgi:ferrous iron transport protein A